MMTKDEIRSLFPDYIYEEIDDEQKEALEAALADYPDLQLELERLLETRTMLRNIPLGEAPHRLLIVRPDPGRLRQWIRDAGELLPGSAFARAGLAAAALLLTAFMLAALAGTHMEVNEAGWNLTIGAAPPAVQQDPDPELLNEMITLIRRENKEIAEMLVEESRLHLEERFRETVESIFHYVDDRRREDLLLVAQELSQMEEENYYRHLVTHETLDDLLFTLQVQR